MGYEELLIIGLNLTFVIGVSVLMTVHHSTTGFSSWAIIISIIY